MRGQALAIALGVASGAATYIMSVSTLDTLESTLPPTIESTVLRMDSRR